MMDKARTQYAQTNPSPSLNGEDLNRHSCFLRSESCSNDIWPDLALKKKKHDEKTTGTMTVGILPRRVEGETQDVIKPE